MGLEFDPTKYGMKDYAAELGKKYGDYSAYHRGRMDALTVPVGKTSTAQNNVPTGLGVEKTEANVPSLEEVEENMNYEGESAKLNSARQLDTKKARKAAVEEAKDNFMKYGTSSNRSPITDEKQAKKMAENYVENEENLENMYSTRTYVDKDAYKKAEKERKAEYKELKKEYREQGLTRREARRKAKSELVNNEYLDNKKARNFVNDHSEQFLDEKGNLSQTKYKQFAFGLTNTHTEADETNNAHLSLKERREAAETYHTKPSVVRDIARSAGADTERDNTGLYRTGFIVGVTGLAAGIGAAVLPSISAVSGSASAAGSVAGGACGGAGSGAVAGAGASATIEGVGAVGGAAIGATGSSLASGFLRDKGNKEAKVYEPGKPKPVSTPNEPSSQTPPEKPVDNIPPVTIEKPCPELRWESDVCDHAVGKGDNWSAVAQAKVLINGKKPDGKLLRAYVHAEKLKHGITNFGLNTMPNVYSQKKYDQLKNTNPEKAEEYKQKTTLRLYSDFADLLADEALVKKHPELELLRDAEITFNCDTKVTHNGNGKPTTPYTKWFGSMTNPVKYKQDCHDDVPVIVK